MGGRILVVEDDENLRIALTDNLVDEGYDVASVADCAGARDAIDAKAFDVVVLDLMLPDGDGTDLCRALKRSGNPARVLMLTARTLEDDLVKGFADGADDYVRKPYRLRELLARIAALVRRNGAPAGKTLGLAGFVVDEDARTLKGPDGALVDVTRSELDLLVLLLAQRGKALSRDEILDRIRGRGVMVDERTVDNFVSSLKKKLRWSKDAPWRIASVRGIGYRLEVDSQ